MEKKVEFIEVDREVLDYIKLDILNTKKSIKAFKGFEEQVILERTVRNIVKKQLKEYIEITLLSILTIATLVIMLGKVFYFW